MPESEREFRVDVEIEHAIRHRGADLRQAEAVEPQHPVGLIEPVFALQRGGRCGEFPGRMAGRRECRLIDALQRVG